MVSGRISFEDGRQRMLIDSALHELNDMLDSAGEDEAQYLNAALRAIRTIDSYVDQLETQMEAGAAVSRNESLYREIHSVGHLAGSMLDRYIENEIAAWVVSTPAFSTDWVRQRLHSLCWSA